MEHHPDPAEPTPETRIRGRVGSQNVELTIQPPAAEAPTAVSENGGGSTLSWETLLGIVGAAAALGLWINVVGGAVLWARFEAADLPASQVVGIVPNSTLLAIGIRALAIPLAVAVVAVALFYVASRPAQPATGSPDPVEPATGSPDVSPSDTSSPGLSGFEQVLVLLTMLAGVALFLMFGGDASGPDNPESLYAWALASPFLVLAAATYEPVNRRLEKEPPRTQAVARILIGVFGFLIIWVAGLRAGHGTAAFWVALIPPVASLLASWLPPGKTFGGISAGVMIVALYVCLGAGLFFWHGGELTLHPGQQGVPLLVALLLTTVALLFLYAVSRRSSHFGLLAVIMFAVVAVWGGAVGHLRERNTEPSFDLTAMLRKAEASADGAEQPRDPVSGYLIARTGDALLVATDSEAFTTEAWRIVVVPRDQVEEMTVGPACTITEENLVLAEALASELEMEHEPTEGSTSTSSRKHRAQCSSDGG